LLRHPEPFGICDDLLCLGTEDEDFPEPIVFP
jgi:hypothetical protein